MYDKCLGFPFLNFEKNTLHSTSCVKKKTIQNEYKKYYDSYTSFSFLTQFNEQISRYLIFI